MADVTVADVEATWLNPGSVQYDAGELRRADAAMFAGDGSNLGVLAGIVPHGLSSGRVTVDAADNVTVQPCAVVIPGNATAGQGCYRSSLPASAVAGLDPRDATNARKDRVVFRVLDTDAVGTHGAYTGRVQVLTGVPSATPSMPALPSMAIHLGAVTVPVSGGAAASVDLSARTYATGLGGLLLAEHVGQLPPAAMLYQEARLLDSGGRYEWRGTAWQLTNPYGELFGGGPAVTFPSGIITQLSLGTLVESFPAGFATTATNGITVPTGLAGLYETEGYGEFDAHATGMRELHLRVNSVAIRKFRVRADNNGNKTPVSMFARVRLNDGDVVDLVGFQNSGTTLGMTDKRLSALRVRD